MSRASSSIRSNAGSARLTFWPLTTYSLPSFSAFVRVGGVCARCIRSHQKLANGPRQSRSWANKRVFALRRGVISPHDVHLGMAMAALQPLACTVSRMAAPARPVGPSRRIPQELEHPESRHRSTPSQTPWMAASGPWSSRPRQYSPGYKSQIFVTASRISALVLVEIKGEPFRS